MKKQDKATQGYEINGVCTLFKVIDGVPYAYSYMSSKETKEQAEEKINKYIEENDASQKRKISKSNKF